MATQLSHTVGLLIEAIDCYIKSLGMQIVARKDDIDRTELSILHDKIAYLKEIKEKLINNQ